VLGIPPEEIMEHRNIGNLLSNNDLSSMSSVQYAVKISQVDHIIICGHYGCNFVKKGLNSHPLASWLKNISDLYNSCQTELDRIKAPFDRDRRFAEIHTLSQAKFLMQREDVARAIRERNMKVHAFMYDADKGECVELKAE